MSFTNVLNDADIALLLQNDTVSSVLSSDALKTRFRLSLPDTIKEKLKSGLGLDLFSVPEVPMMYIRGDMTPHVDSGISDFNNTYLVYLTDSGGKFIVGDAEYDIKKGCGFVFERGLSHGTIGAGDEGRLMIGPMSDLGFEVGEPIVVDGAPCFVASSQLLTPTGYMAAKDIKNGDLLMTADGRQVPVKSYAFTVEKTDKESAPFFIPMNSISMGCPNADLKLSPWHAFQMKKGLWMKPMSAVELGYPVQQYDLGKSVTYYHFEAPDYFKDNFICEGTVVESFGGLQIKNMKGRVYTYSASLKGYTRVASKSASKAILM